jgi:UDP-N-acetylglucosamine--N-acetylmuramyl-(pentapeptide) pyrophosphoryl-undecaprenol N-acetylglucosamine transferase
MKEVLSKLTKKKFAKKSKKIVIAAGGTGGHIFPALYLAKRCIDDGYYVCFVTDKRFYKVVSSDFIDVIHSKMINITCINIGKPKSRFLSIKYIFSISILCLKMFGLCMNSRFSVAIGFGGYVSFPLIIGAFFSRTKSLIHEQNTYLGSVNYVSSFISSYVLTSFPETKNINSLVKHKVIHTGMPINDKFDQYHYKYESNLINYRTFFKVYQKINLVIMGGSQGAKIFSDIVPSALLKLPQEIRDKLNIFQQCRNEEEVSVVEKIYRENNISHNVRTFFPKSYDLFAIAHLLIARAGGGTIAEITATGTPSILVPYKYAKNNHQFLNALKLLQVGGCAMLNEDEMNPDNLRNIVLSLALDEDNLLHMSNQAKSLYNKDSCGNVKRIIDIVTGNCVGNTLGSKTTHKDVDVVGLG